MMHSEKMGLGWSYLYRLHRATSLASKALDAVSLSDREGLFLRLGVARGISPLPELDRADGEAYSMSLADIPIDSDVRAYDTKLLWRFNGPPNG